MRIRPLAGGFEGWQERGLPVDALIPAAPALAS